MRKTALVLAVLFTLLALNGCGGSSQSPAPANNGSTETTKTGGYGY